MKNLAIQLFGMLLIMGMIFTSCQDSTTSTFTNNETLSSLTTKNGSYAKSNGNAPEGLIPNSQRYADNSMPSASGRDGEVTVTSRALIDVAGNVDLEVTTGELDSDDAPGTLTKLQVKALDIESPDKDEPVWVENYNKLLDGGYYTNSYSGLERGQQLYIHANVKGIIRGTAVTFMNETIKARPDIQVTEVETGADEFLVDEDVTITAAIAEGNGDLGASTSCVLYIEGEEVDRADNVWVDAGDIVACQFTTSFAEVGEKNIVVSAEDVLPGDYDGSNNSVYTTITVKEAETGGSNDFYWGGGVFMSSDSYYERRSSSFYEVRESANYFIYFYGYKDLPANFTMPESFSATMHTDGETAVDVDLELINGYYYDSTSGISANIGTWGNRLNFNFSINSYKTVYYGSNDYEGDFHSDYSRGPQFQMGDDISFEVEFGGHTQSGSFDINTYTSEYEYDFGPNDYYVYRYTSYNGYGSGQP